MNRDQSATARRMAAITLLAGLAVSAVAHPDHDGGENKAQAQVRANHQPGDDAPDLTTDPTLYAVGYAHLDTQWRWDFPITIDRFIKDTLEQNFDLFERYPEYVFSFTGSVRYEMMEEYYPEHWDTLKKYIDEGRWFVSGSSVDEGDVNVPSAEAVIRQVLYGNLYFKREFGKESVDFMLPDCFGFPASMPSIWAHCGLLGFSTQKLTWGSAVGIPFKVGVWEGPDGNGIIAALDPGAYAGAYRGGRLDLSDEWANRVNTNGERYGLYADYHYYGVGDMGGAPQEGDVQNYIASLDNPDSKFDIRLAPSDEMYKHITPEQREELPRYKGDMLLTEHSAGTLTSQSYMKRWNRMGEQLADAAERASVAASWLGGIEYPREKLERSWVRLLANQMHDILPGTSIPVAYTWSWNDEVLAMNGFAAVMTDAVGAVSKALDTEVQGTPLVVFNPLEIEREDVVEAEVETSSQAVRVYGPNGEEIPSQVLSREDGKVRVAFLAKAQPNSFSVFEARPAERGYQGRGGPTATDSSLENEFFEVQLNEAGDVASIYDKKAQRELLAAPHRLVFTYEKPQAWPAWNMDWEDRRKPPIGAVDGPAKITVVESGPVRCTIEVERESRGSIFKQRVSLAAGDAGRVVRFDNDIDWQSAECALKASFPLTVANPTATYNWGMGTIDRGNNDPRKYEVPSHEWFDLTHRDGTYGVSVIEDSKFGSDKPTDNEVRLTLLYTPGVRDGYLDQHSQDWGRHDITYGLYGHEGDWREGNSPWRGRRLNQPLKVFQAEKSSGPLGRELSLGGTSNPAVGVAALKLAEEQDVVIVRLQELTGEHIDGVSVTLPGRIQEAWEVDGQERRIGDATFQGNALTTDMGPYSPRSFAVRLAPSSQRVATPKSTPVSLPFDTDVVSSDSNRADGSMDDEGRTIPAEMLPNRIVSEGVTFRMGPTAEGADNAVTARGQQIDLPAGGDQIQILAVVSGEEEVDATFTLDSGSQTFSIQPWTGFIGQWDDRTWDREFEPIDFTTEGRVTDIIPGFIKRDPVAWFATHRHHPEAGNESYRFSYLFRYTLDRQEGDRRLTLPNDPRVKILAATVVSNSNDIVSPAAPLYDDFSDREPVEFRFEYPQAPKAVFQDVEAQGSVQVDRADSFDGLDVGSPSSTDAASAARNVTFRFHTKDGQLRPHGGSGIQGNTLPRLNDGQVSQNEDDTSRSVWFDNEGRITADLGRPVQIDRVNTYSWHVSNRAPQFFSLWGSAAEEMPDPTFDARDDHGWTLLGVVDSRELGQGGRHGSTITGTNGPLGQYRHLLWVTENVGQGTFLTEIDVHAAR